MNIKQIVVGEIVSQQNKNREIKWIHLQLRNALSVFEHKMVTCQFCAEFAMKSTEMYWKYSFWTYFMQLHSFRTTLSENIMTIINGTLPDSIV